MQSILTQTYYGNSLQDWLIAFTIIFVSVLLAKTIYWVCSRFIRLFTAKTKTQWDDMLLDVIEKPAVITVIVVGIWFGLHSLVLPEGLIDFVGKLYQIIFALLVGWLLSRLFNVFYQQYLMPLADKSANDLDDQLFPVVSKGVKTIIWAMAIVIGLNNAGYDVAALIAGLGIGGLALAMAAKDTVSNVFGGFTIFADKPFKLNERIKVAGYDGTVSEIGIRSTRLKTLDGRIVTIPNATFADAPVENISWEPSRKITIDLGLTYNTPPEKMELAMQILEEINAENSHTEDDKIISFNAFGAFAMNIMFVYCIKKGENIAQTQTEINMAILKRFNTAGLEFAFPTQTIYNVKVD